MLRENTPLRYAGAEYFIHSEHSFDMRLSRSLYSTFNAIPNEDIKKHSPPAQNQ